MVGEADRWPWLRGRPDGLACAFFFAGREPGSYQGVREAMVGKRQRNPRASSSPPNASV
jgi:hypothetical protein